MTTYIISITLSFSNCFHGPVVQDTSLSTHCKSRSSVGLVERGK